APQHGPEVVVDFIEITATFDQCIPEPPLRGRKLSTKESKKTEVVALGWETLPLEKAGRPAGPCTAAGWAAESGQRRERVGRIRWRRQGRRRKAAGRFAAVGANEDAGERIGVDQPPARIPAETA